MKKLILLIILFLLAGCINMNMNKQPDRWITILDAETGKPVSGVPLVYMSIRKPYFIVGKVMISREYVSDTNGKAYIPSGIRMIVAPESNYIEIVSPVDDEKSNDPIKATTFYVKTNEQYMKEMIFYGVRSSFSVCTEGKLKKRSLY